MQNSRIKSRKNPELETKIEKQTLLLVRVTAELEVEQLTHNSRVAHSSRIESERLGFLPVDP